MQTTVLVLFLGVLAVLSCLAATTSSAEIGETEPAPGPDLDLLASYLKDALYDDSWGDNGGPLVYVEDLDEDNHMPLKRSRYYRRYPWKRQNNRDRVSYIDDNRYMCNPSREDVFQLLVALHEARAGNHGRTVSFCNMKRPASTIFTNIRFLGKRRK